MAVNWVGGPWSDAVQRPEGWAGYTGAQTPGAGQAGAGGTTSLPPNPNAGGGIGAGATQQPGAGSTPGATPTANRVNVNGPKLIPEQAEQARKATAFTNDTIAQKAVNDAAAKAKYEAGGWGKSWKELLGLGGQQTPETTKTPASKPTIGPWKGIGAATFGGLGGGYLGDWVSKQFGVDPNLGALVGSGVGAAGAAGMAGGLPAVVRYVAGPTIGALGARELFGDVARLTGNDKEGAQNTGTVVGGIAGTNPYAAAALGGYGALKAINNYTAGDETHGLGYGDALVRGLANVTGIDALKRLADENESNAERQYKTRKILANDTPTPAGYKGEPNNVVDYLANLRANPVQYGSPEYTAVTEWLGSDQGKQWLSSTTGQSWSNLTDPWFVGGPQQQAGLPQPAPAGAAPQGQPGQPAPGAPGQQAPGQPAPSTPGQQAPGQPGQPQYTVPQIVSDSSGQSRLSFGKQGTVEFPGASPEDALAAASRIQEGQKWLQRTGGNTFANAAALAGGGGFATANTPTGELLRYGGETTRLADGTVWSPGIAAARKAAADRGDWQAVNRSLGLQAPQAQRSGSSDGGSSQPETLAEQLYGRAQGGGDFIAKASMRHQIENTLDEMSRSGRGGAQIAQSYMNLLGQSTGGRAGAASRPDHALELENLRDQRETKRDERRAQREMERDALNNQAALEKSRFEAGKPIYKAVPETDKLGMPTGNTKFYKVGPEGFMALPQLGGTQQGTGLTAPKGFRESISPEWQAFFDSIKNQGGTDDQAYAAMMAAVQRR